MTTLVCAAAITFIAGCSGSSSTDVANLANGPVASSVVKLPARAGTPQDDRALELLAQMTLEEKIDMLHGEFNGLYSFYNGPIERLGIPALTMADGAVGVHINNPATNGGRSTLMPSSLALASTWDSVAAQEYGRLLGDEAHKTGNNVLLAPQLDIVRVPWWGRLAETFGEDPLLVGAIGGSYIMGVQESPVIATLKHFIGYTQETNRLVGSNMVMDERTLQEIYGRAAWIALRNSNPGAVMSSFNEINGVSNSENEVILNQLLKDQYGFQGWVMTDFNTIFETVPAILAGLDQEMPGDFGGGGGPSPYPAGTCRFCTPLLDAVNAGVVPLWRIDDAVLRILRTMFEHGLFDQPAVIEALPEAENSAKSREIAEQGMVLLKNDAATLPLTTVESIAVIGADADVLVTAGGAPKVTSTSSVSVLDGIRSRAGAGVTVQHIAGTDPVTSVAVLPGPDPVPSDFLTPAQGSGQGLRGEYFLNLDFSGTPELDRTDPYAAINGGFFIFPGLNGGSPHFPDQPVSLNSASSIRWTGMLTAPVTGSYELALTTSGTSRLFIDDVQVASTVAATTLGDVKTVTAALDFQQGSTHSVRIEFINDAPQGTDSGPQFKFGWTPPDGVIAPQAIAAAEAARSATVAIVVVRDYAGEGGDKQSLRLPNGQPELIRQVAAANPRTIVVVTTGGVAQTSDWDATVPAVLQAWLAGQEQGNAVASILFGDVNPSGKLPVTIPVDDAQTPVSTPEQFPGVNMDSTFSEGIFVGYRGYEQMQLKPRYAFGHGLSYTTYEYANLRVGPTSVTVNVKNTGTVAGSEIVQVYAGALSAPVPTAPKALAGFGKVALEPGEARDVIILLSPESLSYWDETTDKWVRPPGEVPIMVGASSADIRLNGVVPERKQASARAK